MALILSLETATEVCAVALSDGPQLLGELRIHQPQRHASLLTQLVGQLTADLQLPLQQLQAVACCAGPGSYTGLRIGVSAAKGYCLALGIPLIAVDSLLSVAAPLQPLALQLGACLLPMLDARRMEVYMAAYAADLSVLYPPAAVVVDEAVPHTLPPGPRLYCGDGLAKCQHLLQRPGDLYFPQQLSSAAGMAQLAWQHWQARQFVPLHSYSPNYLKPVRLTQPAGGQQPTSPAEENKD